MKVERDRVTDYVRIRKGKARDPDIIHRGLQKGLRIEHPERIAGYAGFFYEPGDVYAITHIARYMEYERFRVFVEVSLKRFEKGDFGDISGNDNDENIENRWLFGIDRLFGRYGFYLYDSSKGSGRSYDIVICIRKHQGNTWITSDSDPDWFLLLTDDELEQLKDLKDLEPEE